MTLTPVRQKLVDLMRATLDDEERHRDWTYWAVRPMPVPSITWKPGQHVVGDCSKGVQYLCRWAGAPDPMGRNYDPIGNSQTLWMHLPHASSASELEPGDIITSGEDASDHAAMVLEAGRDPLLWSFGHQGAPNSYRLSYDRREHQYLILMHDPVVPKTPEDKLRARTGFLSWVAWRLAEGPWRHYQPRTASVRPDVPRVIPFGWWRRYRRFMANREKGNGPS